MTASLIRVLDVMATEPEGQVDLLVVEGFLDEPLEQDGGVTELINDFFEEMVPMMDFEEEWRTQFPNLAILSDAFPDNWWEKESINSVFALRTSSFWVEIRTLAYKAKKEVSASYYKDSVS